MSTIGTGDQDWVEQDLDAFDHDRRAALNDALRDHADELTELLGSDFDVSVIDDELVLLTLDGTARYRAELDREGRLVLTSLLAPDGPL